MKTNLRIGCIALLLAGISSSFGFSKENMSNAAAESGPINIHQEPRPQGAPRSPEETPFIAELMDGSCTVLLGATDIIGTVYVEIVSTAGDDYSTYFNTAIGAIYLPISGNSGNYTLTIITPDGTHYVGEFSI